MDKLKKYLQDNKDGLNYQAPPEEVWQSIQKGIVPERQHRKISYFRSLAAACILLIAGLSIFSLFYFNNTGKDNTITESDVARDTIKVSKTEIKQEDFVASQTDMALPGNIISAYRSDKKNADSIKKVRKSTVFKKAALREQTYLEQMQASYTSFIGTEIKKIETIPIYAESAEYFSSYKKQFIDLEAEESFLLRRHGNIIQPDFLIDRLIDIYLQKITVLKQLRSEIRSMNQQGIQFGNTGTKPSFIKL